MEWSLLLVRVVVADAVAVVRPTRDWGVKALIELTEYPAITADRAAFGEVSIVY